jgi:hypothetical protein
VKSRGREYTKGKRQGENGEVGLYGQNRMKWGGTEL